MSVAERSGGCLCGAVRLRLSSLDEEVVACHCSRCRRWTGSVLLAVSVAAEGMRVEGREAVTLHRAARAERAFCARCGSSLWFRYTDRSDADYEICVGVLDDAAGLRLVREIWVDEKPGGYALAGEDPRETGAEREARRLREEAVP